MNGGSAKRRSKADTAHAIDLLWIHQVRRENAFLHKQLQQLQQTSEKRNEDRQALCNTVEKADSKALKISNSVDSALTSLATVQDTVDSNSNAIVTLKDRLDQLKGRLEALQGVQQNYQRDSNERLQQAIDNGQQGQQITDDNVSKLQATVAKMEKEFGPDKTTAGIDAVVARLESLETQLRCFSKTFDGAAPEAAIEIGDTATAGDEVIRKDVRSCEIDDQTLTVRNAETARESTDAESFDLDQNVAMPSYALHAARRPPSDSLKPIDSSKPETCVDLKSVELLRQGRYHSLDRYFAEAESLLKQLSPDQETYLMRAFVNGLYAASDRAHCRQWLNQLGWTWENLAAFSFSSTPSVHARPHTQIRVHCRPEPTTLPSAPLTSPTRSNISVQEMKQSNHANPLQGSSQAHLRRSQRLAGRKSDPIALGQPQQSKALERLEQLEQDTLPDKRVELTAHRLQGRSNDHDRLTDAETRRNDQDGKTTNRTTGAHYLHAAQYPNAEAPVFDVTAENHSPSRDIIHDSTADRDSPPVIGTPVKRKAYLPSAFESDLDADHESTDGLELPTLPTKNTAGRKRLKRQHNRHRRARTPPPEIPILPTSDD